ncbi:MAG: Unknown protein [uncultured Aureispira sp.]|uniref:Uncharacterized protein n=1 Tax=uncultured Aureispira sp. TaxID=1331704 RepID=A0A6S6UGJ6_9BACT|nr:MAG: Unknown protein [uncultured Aureispira sp.]
MVRDIYFKENYVQTLVEGKVIHAVWKNLSKAEVIYASCNAQIKVVQNEGCNVVIIDMLDSRTTPPMECQKWFGEVLFPEFLKNPNFKALINVLPKGSVITKMGANHWKKTVEKAQLGFDVYETYSVAEAKKLAASL